MTITGTRLDEDEEEVLVVVEDLTEEDRLAARVRVSERRFEEVIEHATDGMILMDQHGRVAHFNKAAEKMFGWLQEELLGEAVTVLLPENQRLAQAEWLARQLANGQRLAPGTVTLVEGLRKDGRVFPVEVSVTAYQEDTETVFLGALRDVTEQKALTARLMQMDRLVAVGTLAAGVAHEINNPLAYVISNLGLLQEDLPGLIAAARAAGGTLASERSFTELEEMFAEALEGANRVRKIVRDLKVFSRTEDEGREPVSLPRVLESAVNMAWNEIRHRARLVKDLGPVPMVEATESRLGQVVLNLLVNAAHAIREGHAEGNEIRLVTSTDQRGHAVIEVRDTGCGIPVDALARIFDPFFTTKPVGQGTGLGLSICRSIVSGFGGTIDVKSEVGKGSVFRVTLPPALPDAVMTPPPVAPRVEPGRRGRILIVDDEPMLGVALRRVLTGEHDVVVSMSGREAFALMAENAFDVVLCDLMMPEMTGMDLHEEVCRRFPDQAQRIIFMTGGAFTSRAKEFLDRVPNQRMEKPVNGHNLRAVVRDLLR